MNERLICPDCGKKKAWQAALCKSCWVESKKKPMLRQYENPKREFSFRALVEVVQRNCIGFTDGDAIVAAKKGEVR